MIEDIIKYFFEEKRITEHEGNSKGYALYTLDPQLRGKPIFLFKKAFRNLVKEAQKSKDKKSKFSKPIHVELDREYDNQLTEDVVLFYDGTAYISLDLSSNKPKLGAVCEGYIQWM